jgi:hypothetical protein
VTKGTLTIMNPPEEITPEYAERLVALLGMMGDLDRQRLGFLVGHMASKNLDLAIEAYGALMATDVPLDGSGEALRVPPYWLAGPSTWASCRAVGAGQGLPRSSQYKRQDSAGARLGVANGRVRWC